MSSDEDPFANRRADPRLPIVLTVEYKRVNAFFAYYTQNISRGGTFIATERPLPVGTEFVFKLSVPKVASMLELRGRVVHVVRADEATPEKPAGMGIQFLRDGSAAQRELDETFEALMIDALGEDLYRRLTARR